MFSGMGMNRSSNSPGLFHKEQRGFAPSPCVSQISVDTPMPQCRLLAGEPESSGGAGAMGYGGARGAVGEVATRLPRWGWAQPCGSGEQICFAGADDISV